MDAKKTAKLCFVISPIGEAGSKERAHADFLLLHIIKPVLSVEPFHFDVKRADNFPTPGQITTQIINAVEEAELVVADLTFANPNAFYELAIRHMRELPVIHMVEQTWKLPFDIAQSRTIHFQLDAMGIFKAQADLKDQAEAVLSSDHKIDNPIVAARGRKRLTMSTATDDQIVAGLASQLEELTNRMGFVEKRLARDVPNPLGRNQPTPYYPDSNNELSDAAYGGKLSPVELSAALGKWRINDDTDVFDKIRVLLANVKTEDK